MAFIRNRGEGAPWAYPGSRFTKDFDLTVGWPAVCLSRSTASEYMRVDWESVGRCVSRTLHEIEPDRSRRLNGLVRIGIDETNYKKGHKHITVIMNHGTNTVVWGAKDTERLYWIVSSKASPGSSVIASRS